MLKKYLNLNKKLNWACELAELKRINSYFYGFIFDLFKLKGNCWFIAGVAGMIQNYELFTRVVPFDNYFDDSRYTGLSKEIIFY